MSAMSDHLVSHVHFTSISGIPIRYYCGGIGENLILIHGLGASLDYWYKNIPFLTQHFKVLAIDLPGFGQSGKKNIPQRDQFYVDFFKRLMNHFGMKKANFVAHSMGGGLMLHFALQHPDCIQKLFLISNIGFARQVGIAFRLLTIPGLRSLLMRFSKKQYARALRQHVYDPKSVSNTFINTSYPMAKNPETQKILLKILSDSANIFGIKAKALMRSEANIAQFAKTAMAVLWGREDPVLNYKVYSRASKHYLPHAPLTTLERCGHLPQLEHPDQVNDLLLQFFSTP